MSPGVAPSSSPSTLIGLGVAVRKLTRVAVPRSNRSGLRKAKSEMGDAGKQLPNCAGTHEIEIERAVIDRGMLRHGETAAVKASIADAHLVDGA